MGKWAPCVFRSGDSYQDFQVENWHCVRLQELVLQSHISNSLMSDMCSLRIKLVTKITESLRAIWKSQGHLKISEQLESLMTT